MKSLLEKQNKHKLSIMSQLTLWRIQETVEVINVFRIEAIPENVETLPDVKKKMLFSPSCQTSFFVRSL